MIFVTTREQRNKKGFTLVELLVAISLLAILSGVLFSVINPQGIRAKARDSQRISDLAKIKIALESYFSDNRRYPIYSSWRLASSVSGLSTDYINKVPDDPKNMGTICSSSSTWRRYAYKSDGAGTKYVLATNMETTAMGGTTCPTLLSSLCDCIFTGGTGYYAYAD